MQRLCLNADDPQRVVYFLSEDLRWNLKKVVKAKPEELIPKESIYVTQDGTTGIHCIVDPLVHMTYLVVRGPREDEVAAAIRKSTAIIDHEAAVAMIATAQTPSERMRAVACVALTAPESFDAETFQLLRRAFQDPDPNVREVAAWVTVYPAWPELQPLLETMRAGDPIEELRADAARLLKGFEAESAHPRTPKKG
jgi:hypothetical protein